MGLDFTGIELPFSPMDLLSSGNGLFKIVGGFIMLALAFKVVPLFVGLIRNSFSAARGR